MKLHAECYINFLLCVSVSNLEKFSSQNHFGVIHIVIITVAVTSLVALVALVALKYKKRENQGKFKSSITESTYL